MHLFESPDVSVLHFYLWGWMNSEVYKRRVDTGDELLVRIFGWCCLRKERWRSTQTNNTWSSPTSCRVHWGWQIYWIEPSLHNIQITVANLQLVNPVKAELILICHLLALLGVRHIIHVSRIRVNQATCFGLVRPSSGLQKMALIKVHSFAIPTGSHGLHWSLCLFKKYLLLIKNDIIQKNVKCYIILIS